MQIDFHHAATYAIARLAGFNHADADIIAYAAQYVDDATDEGDIDFTNEARYTRISSAHRTFGLKNFQDDLNHRVWIPFHFLPGNNGLPPGADPDGSFIHKIMCRPNSAIAKDMVEAAILDQEKPYGLHRLGITMHVYADTWAHQGFAGIKHRLNEVKDVVGDDVSIGFSGWADTFLSAISINLGHAKAEHLPDMPFMSWQYTDGLSRKVSRNNLEEFMDAANSMCRAMQRYRGVDGIGLDAQAKDVFQALFTEIRDAEGEDRHARWLGKLAEGVFSFGPAEISYDPEEKRWRKEAIGEPVNDVDPDNGTNTTGNKYEYRPEFLTSNWKLFHDALQAYRFSVFHDILPRYGICAG